MRRALANMGFGIEGRLVEPLLQHLDSLDAYQEMVNSKRRTEVPSPVFLSRGVLRDVRKLLTSVRAMCAGPQMETPEAAPWFSPSNLRNFFLHVKHNNLDDRWVHADREVEAFWPDQIAAHQEKRPNPSTLTPPYADHALVLNIVCLNASLGFQPIAASTRAIILASGTLSPLLAFEAELGVPFKLKYEANHVIDVKKQVFSRTVSQVFVPPLNKFVKLLGSFEGKQNADYFVSVEGPLQYHAHTHTYRTPVSLTDKIHTRTH